MGKAIPNLIKVKSQELLNLMPDAFNDNFENNKLKIRELKLPFSKKQQNLMAGYITRIKKEKE